MNYKAFAYMDSARGLYAKDLKKAECRLKQSHELLEKIHEKGNENRRYLDCNVETVSMLSCFGKYRSKQ